MRASSSQRFSIGVAFLLALAYPIVMLAFAHARSGGQHSFPLDEAWVHLTYARQLHEHGSLAYFPGGSPSAGSASPFFVALLSIGFLFTGDEKVLAYCAGIAGHAFFAGALGLWVRQRLSWKAAAPAMLLAALDSRIGILSVSGMETTWFLGWVCLSFYAYAARRRYLLAIALGLSVWTRPEGLLLCVVFALDALLSRWTSRTPIAIASGRSSRRSSRSGSRQSFLPADWRRPLLTLTAFVVAYLLFHGVAYRTLLPNPVFAAMESADASRANFLFRDLPSAFFVNAWLLASPLALLAVIAELRLLTRRQQGVLRAEAGWVGLLLLALFLFAPFSNRYSRYLVPALPALSLLSLHGLGLVLHWIVSLRGRADSKLNGGAPSSAMGGKLEARVHWVVALAMVALQAGAAALSAPEYERAYLYTLLRQERVGRWLLNGTPETAVVATTAPGAVGYYSHRRVLDLTGNIDRVSASLRNGVSGTGTGAFGADELSLGAQLDRLGVTHLVVSRSRLEVANADPLFVATPRPEIFEVFAWDPTQVHFVDRKASILNEQAAVSLEAGQIQRAREVLAASLEVDGETARTWYLSGLADEMASDFAHAAISYRRSIELQPGNLEARYRLALSLLGSGQKAEALSALRELLQRKPDYPEAMERYIALQRELANGPRSPLAADPGAQGR